MLRRNLIAAAGLSGLRLAYGSTMSSGLAKQPISGSKITLATSYPLSGPAAIIGEDLDLGIRACIAMANRQGGIEGVPLEFVALDDAYKPPQCRTNIDALIKQGVAGLIMPAGTPTCLAALPLIKESGIPVFGMYTGAEALRDFIPNIYHLRASYLQEVQKGMKQLLNSGPEIALCLQNDAYGEAIGNASIAVLAAQGAKPIKPVAIGKFERNSLDVREAARQVQNSSAKGVMFGGTSKQLAALVDILGLGYAYQTVSFAQTTGVVRELGTRARGFGISQVVPYPWSKSTRLHLEYQAAMAAIGQKESTYGSFEGFMATKVAVRALRASAGRLSWANIVEAAQQDHDLQGFRVSFDRANRQGSGYVDLTMIDQWGKVTT